MQELAPELELTATCRWHVPRSAQRVARVGQEPPLCSSFPNMYSTADHPATTVCVSRRKKPVVIPRPAHASVSSNVEMDLVSNATHVHPQQRRISILAVRLQLAAHIASAAWRWTASCSRVRRRYPKTTLACPLLRSPSSQRLPGASRAYSTTDNRPLYRGMPLAGVGGAEAAAVGRVLVVADSASVTALTHHGVSDLHGATRPNAR